MQSAFSLLAYSDPKSGPLASLLDPAHRQPIADDLNSAILGVQRALAHLAPSPFPPTPLSSMNR